MYTYRARLAPMKNGRHPVYDADTYTLEIDLGFGVTQTTKVRLFGVDAWEVRGSEAPQGKVARDYVRELLDGQEFTVQTHKDSKGKYGRYLADVVMDDGLNLADTLVKKGMAEPATY